MRLVPWSVALVLASGLGAQAQQPYLVRDVNPIADPSPGLEPTTLEGGSNRLFFYGRDLTNGRELWTTTGTAASTAIVGDLWLFPSPFLYDLVASGDVVYFPFPDPATGLELWRSDGTMGGTRLVRNVNPGPSSSEPLQLVADGGLVYWVADDGSGPGVWRTDGTEGGTFRIHDGPASVLTPLGDRLYFLAPGTPAGEDLWTSDGSVAGTALVRSVCSTSSRCFLGDYVMTPAGGLLYLLVDDGVHGGELWRSDGTPGNTVLVADLTPGPAQTVFGPAVGAGSALYFRTEFGPSRLWRVQPTGTPELLLESNGIETLAASGSQLYFTVENPNSDVLWRSDGSPAGTQPVAPFCSTAGGAGCLGTQITLVASPTQAFLRVDDGTGGAASIRLVRSDGTPGGTFDLVQGDVSGESLTIWQDQLYFTKRDDVIGEELWKSDGSVSGTGVVYDLVGSSSVGRPVLPAQDRVWFPAWRPDLGSELWTSGGTAATTTGVDLVPGPEAFGSLTLGVLGRDAIFEVNGAPNLATPQLWFSDGTAGGTRHVADVGAARFFELGGSVLFSGGPGSQAELWRTDGSAAGTFLLKDIAPGPDNSFPRSLGAIGAVHLLATSNFPSALWRTDGTTDGTFELAPIPAIEAARLGSFMVLAAGGSVWRSDGTAAGTTLVKDLPPPVSSSPQFLTPAGGWVYFVVNSFPVPQKLWRTDGTEAGTTLVVDLPCAVQFPMTALQSTLYFLCVDDAHGHELWRSDGTAAGTSIVKDIVPGPGWGIPPIESGTRSFAAVGGRLWFPALSPSGVELWRSDGTEAGTVQHADLRAGAASSGPRWFVPNGDRLYFTADDGVHDRELWAVDTVLQAGAADVVATETDAPGAVASFAVRLSAIPTETVTVGYATADGTAVAGSDYVAQSGTLTFVAAGPQELAVTVPLVADLHDEDDETFTLQIQSTGPVVIPDGEATATIIDDDAPRIAIASTTATEGNVTNTIAVLPVVLTTEDGTPTPTPQLVSFATEGITATSGVDFGPTAGTLTFPAGTSSGTATGIAVQVIGDTIDEADETFAIRLQASGDAVLATPTGTGRILDDDGIEAGPPTEIAPGSALRADFAPPAGRASDRDDYVLLQQPCASYEVVIDEAAGVAVPLTFVRMAPDGTTVLQSGSAVGTGSALSLRWQNTGNTTIGDERLSVSSASCGSTCGAADGYRLRAYETTLSAPRFNNVNGQGTVVLLQNRSGQAIAGRLNFWTTFGTLGLAHPFTVPAHGAIAINTLALYEASGTLTVTHDGPYGALVGKAVALEPATGFSFDTPLTSRPR